MDKTIGEGVGGVVSLYTQVETCNLQVDLG